MAGSFIIGDSRTVGEAGTQGVKVKVTQKSKKTGKVISRADDLGGRVKHINTAKGLGNDGNYYYASGGHGYKWFSTATEDIVKEVEKSGTDNIVIQLGVNDIGGFLKESDKNSPTKVAQAKNQARNMAKKYVKEALELSAKTGKPIVFVSANPVEGDSFTTIYGTFSPNIVIQEFNAELEKEAKANGMSFVSTYDMVDEKLKKNPKLAWSDNVHYSTTLSKSVRTYVNKEVAGLNLVAQTKTVATPEKNAHSSTAKELKTQKVKNEVKTESAVAKIELENGKFTLRVRRDVVARLTPIFGAENAKKIEALALINPKIIDDALGIKRSKLSSKATLEHLLTLEGEDIEKVIAAAKGKPIKTIERKTTKVKDVSVDNAKAKTELKQDLSAQSSKDKKEQSGEPASAKERFAIAKEQLMRYLFQFESIELNAYLAPEGNWTIGLGNITHPNGRAVKRGDKITVDQAIEYFEDYQDKNVWKKLKEYGIDVDKMSVQDFVAVASLAWNCGGGVIRQIKTKLNAYLNDKDNVAKKNALREAFIRRCTYKKKGRRIRCNALLKRREMEVAVMFGDIKLSLDEKGSDPNTIYLNHIDKGAFNSGVKLRNATKYDKKTGTYTNATDTISDINRFSKNHKLPSFNTEMKKLEKGR